MPASWSAAVRGAGGGDRTRLAGHACHALCIGELEGRVHAPGVIGRSGREGPDGDLGAHSGKDLGESLSREEDIRCGKDGRGSCRRPRRGTGCGRTHSGCREKPRQMRGREGGRGFERRGQRRCRRTGAAAERVRGSGRHATGESTHGEDVVLDGEQMERVGRVCVDIFELEHRTRSNRARRRWARPGCIQSSPAVAGREGARAGVAWERHRRLSELRSAAG
jgi:hypothetical protein